MTPTPLNTAQKAAVESGSEPLLIIAGAGTGKTRTLTERIKHLIDLGVDPSRIIAVTFTNKAAKEMRERALHGMEGSTPWIGTFHSFGARFLRKHAPLAGRTRDFTIYDDGDMMTLFRRIAKALPGKVTAAPLRTRISAIKNGSTTIAELEKENSQTSTSTVTAYHAYEEALKENNAFDFDDLIVTPARILEEHPQLRARYQEEIGYVLIDEYQDINEAQYRLVRALVGNTGHLTVVGDDHQTIYSWRGSNIGIFMAFERDFANAKVIRLEENYRSTQTIIAASNAVISNNKHQLPKTLVSTKEVGPPITVIEQYTELDEAMWIAQKLGAYVREEKGTAAVLYRTNAQARAIEHALVRARVPYHVFGGVQFYDRLEVRDALAAIRVAANPQDTLGEERLLKTFKKRKGVPLVAALRAVGSTDPARILDVFLAESHYAEHLEEEFDNAEDRLENVIELRKFASTFDNVTDFLEHVSLVQSTDTRGERANKGITLMTAHMAKGLEFDRVHIAGASEGTMPHSRALVSHAELEEERRLFYVAMTRARHELSISFVHVPSRFLLEIPEEYTEVLGRRGRLLALDDEDRYIDVLW